MIIFLFLCLFLIFLSIKAKQWHQLGIMTSRREKKEDFEFFFDSVKKAYMQCTGEAYRPTCLVADADGAITNGLMNSMKYKSISEFSRVVCWQHVKRAIEKHLCLVSKEFKNEVKSDIHILQACQSKEILR